MLGLPALAWGAGGGGGVGLASGSSGADTSIPTAQPGNQTVTASGDGIRISSHASALLNNGLRISGNAPRSDAGRTVEIERWGAKTHWTWRPTAQAPVASDGSFTAVWRTNHIGRFAVRAVISRPGAASASAGLPSVNVTVYLPAVATLYGPGLYGRRTACGVLLRRTTVGVAHRWLPCGTPVAIYYEGRTLVVPVIDRGPYANGANWDLTVAAGKALEMQGTAGIGAVSLPRAG
jgi:peptidoglycan lytic transglycosylase